MLLKFLKARPEDVVNINTVNNHVLLLPISVYYRSGIKYDIIGPLPLIIRVKRRGRRRSLGPLLSSR